MGKARKPGKGKADLSAAVSAAAAVVAPSLESRIAHDTKNHIKNAADERAAKRGYVYDADRGQYVCDWMERECYLYQGIGAGAPIVLIPYQREFIMTLFSWVGYSDDWNEWIRRFRVANLLAAKKNGKTPLMAALGIYLTVADNEPGANVYQSAKNGKQAARTQEHAIAMVEQSPGLKYPVCVINKATLTISHPATRSKLQILSGDDTRGAQTAEGINGSILIDELHVFDREMHERTSRLGRSRKQPLNIAFSTAGDDPSSYGFERTEYGRQVNSGKRDDDHFLHVEYAAPQKAKDADIDAHIEEYARAANPAVGRLVRMSELVEDWRTSRDKPREVNRCKQYTFNIWVGSVSPWLSESRWAANARPLITPTHLRGREAFLGIDLSRTRDMTACVLAFAWPEESEESVFLWPMFWVPQGTADKRKNLFPYLDWAEAGYLTLTEGDVVDFAAVEDDVCRFIENHDICVTDIYFDQHYAEEFTQRVAERLNANRTAVSQTLMTLSPFAKEFERRIDLGAILHPGNAVLDWQVGHVQVYTDRNQNVRPVKPDPNTGKCIDGIMATLDTFAGLMGLTGEESEPTITFF